MNSKKDSPKKYDINSRRTTTFQKGNKAATGKKNALGSSQNKRARDLEITHDYVVFMSQEKEPLKVMMQYKGEARGWYVRICESICSEIRYIEFGYLIRPLHEGFHKRKLKTFGRDLYPKEKEAMKYLSEKYHLSEEAIRTVIKNNRMLARNDIDTEQVKIQVPPKRIYLAQTTHQQHLVAAQECINHMELIILADIQERRYEKDEHRQVDINNTKQHFAELRQSLVPLERRAKEEPSGKAYVNTLPPRPTYLHNILRSSSYLQYEADRLKWMKKLRNK